MMFLNQKLFSKMKIRKPHQELKTSVILTQHRMKTKSTLNDRSRMSLLKKKAEF